MSAQWMPQENLSPVVRPLEWLTDLITRFPLATLVLAGLTALGSIALTVGKLQFRTSRAELLNPKSDFNRRWIEYTKHFGDKEDVVIVVEGAGPQQVIPAIEDILQALSQRADLFEAVLGKIDLTGIRSKGLYYLGVDELAAIGSQLEQLQPVLRGDWRHLGLASIGGAMLAGPHNASPAGQQQLPANLLGQMDRLSASLAAAFGQPAEYLSPWPEIGSQYHALAEMQTSYLLENEGRLGFVLLRLADRDESSFARNSASIDALRALLEPIKAARPEVKIGLTGLPIIENDEMRASERSMSLATCLSFLGVLAVMIVAFGAWRHSTMAMLALLLGMIWACGCVTLVIGYVTILSIAFGSVLFGLGIDYGVYYVSRYLQVRQHCPDTRDALLQTVRSLAPALTTGAVTSALAFFAAGLTEFSGVAQLGIIAGCGILLCWAAQVIVLPAMIQLADRHWPPKTTPSVLDLNDWFSPVFTRPRTTLLVVAGCTVLLALGLPNLWYDHNLLRMQPAGLESVDLEQRLCQQLSRSAYYALSMADSPEELRARQQQFLALPSVERVEDLSMLFPEGVEQKRPLIEAIRRQLDRLPANPPQAPAVGLADLEKLFGGAMLLAQSDRSGQLAARLAALREAIAQIPPGECQRRFSEFQQRAIEELFLRLRTLYEASNPEPPKPEDLPEAVVVRFVGSGGKLLQKVYARGSIWDMEEMRQFVEQVRSVDAEITGNPLQIYEASRQMKQSYELAAVFALLVIVPLILLDYRSISHTLLAMIPTGLGMLQLFGLMGLIDIPLNPANMLLLPFFIGISVECGVHLVHDFRNQGDQYKTASPSTTLSVVVNTLTTMVGFATLMIATHRGLQSLGRAMTLAMGCCLVSSLVLPSILLLFGRHFRSQSGQQTALQELPQQQPARQSYRRAA